MSVTIYRSTDTSAPVLTGQVGSLTTLLHNCLVAGYGSKAAAGWTSAFGPTGNVEVYRQGAGNLHYFRVEDNATGAGLAKEAHLRGWEVKANVNDVVDATNTGPFPTIAQLAVGTTIRKSLTADATARAWLIAADSRTCYGFLSTGDLAGLYYVFAFGELYSFLSGDNYDSFVIARNADNTGGAASSVFETFNTSPSSLSGHYMARSYGGLGGSIALGKMGAMGSSGFRSTIPFPNGPDGGLYLNPIVVNEAVTFHIRGRLRGIFMPAHVNTTYSDGDTFSGAGAYTGRTFLVVRDVQDSGGTKGAVIVETTDWETSA